MQSRYRKEESLITLNLVEEIKGNKEIKLYKLTEFGKEIIENLKK